MMETIANNIGRFILNYGEVRVVNVFCSSNEDSERACPGLEWSI